MGDDRSLIRYNERMNKPRKNSLINIALNHLAEKSIEFLDLSLKIIFDPQEIVRETGFTKNLHTLSDLFKNVYKLKYSSYFKYEKNKLYLSEKGRLEIIKRLVKNNIKTQKWDGKWWAIIFDIPEANRRERSFLRKELKWLGFKELQHSVWIFPFNIEKELLALLELWKKDFIGDIRFLKIDKITGDKDIKTFFKL